LDELHLYYEDLKKGFRFSSPARTVTEADIVNFAGLSADYNPLHIDAEYGRKSIFGERVAHGLLGLVIASGLFTRTDLNFRCRKSLIALLSVDSWKFLGPIRIGDTVHLEVEVADKRVTSKPDRGVVVFRRILINQRGETVQEGNSTMLIYRRKADSN